MRVVACGDNDVVVCPFGVGVEDELFGLFEVSTVGADVLLTWKSAVFMDGINRCFASNASKVALFFLGCGVISRL